MAFPLLFPALLTALGATLFAAGCSKKVEEPEGRPKAPPDTSSPPQPKPQDHSDSEYVPPPDDGGPNIVIITGAEGKNWPLEKYLVVAARSDQEVMNYTKDLQETSIPFPVPPSKFQSWTFKNETEALQNILKEKPRAVMFGELHRRTRHPGASSQQIFANRILPALQGEFHHLISESLPSDLPEEEMKWFAQHQRRDPQKTPRFHEFKDMALFPEDEEAIYLSAFKNNIRLHGGSPKMEDIKRWMDHPEQINKYGSRTITDICRKKAGELLKKGERIITLNGAYHNDLKRGMYSDETFEKMSYADELAADYKVIEIDLVIPQSYTGYFRLTKEFSYLDYLRQYTPYIPPEGHLTLVQRDTHSFTLVYPFIPES